MPPGGRTVLQGSTVYLQKPVNQQLSFVALTKTRKTFNKNNVRVSYTDTELANMVKPLEGLAIRDAKIQKPDQKALTLYSCDFEVTEAQSLEKGVSYVYNFVVRCFYN